MARNSRRPRANERGTSIWRPDFGVGGGELGDGGPAGDKESGVGTSARRRREGKGPKFLTRERCRLRLAEVPPPQSLKKLKGKAMNGANFIVVNHARKVCPVHGRFLPFSFFRLCGGGSSARRRRPGGRGVFCGSSARRRRPGVEDCPSAKGQSRRGCVCGCAAGYGGYPPPTGAPRTHPSRGLRRLPPPYRGT